MTRIGITGHQILSQDTKEYARRIIKELLARYGDLVGISSLAAGADQAFAQVVLSLHGSLAVIVPAENYETTFEDTTDLLSYKTLLSQAVRVTVLPFTEPSEDAYMAAGQEMVRQSDSLIAVWDGQPAKGKGGTADVVEYARTLRVPVTVVWPLESIRD